MWQRTHALQVDRTLPCARGLAWGIIRLSQVLFIWWYDGHSSSFGNLHVGFLFEEMIFCNSTFVTCSFLLLGVWRGNGVCFYSPCVWAVSPWYDVHIKIHTFPLARSYSALSQFLRGWVIPFIINFFLQFITQMKFYLQRSNSLTSCPSHPFFFKPLLPVKCLEMFSTGY